MEAQEDNHEWREDMERMFLLFQKWTKSAWSLPENSIILKFQRICCMKCSVVSKFSFAAVYFKGLWSLCHFATFIIWQILIAATFRAESWVYLECNNDNCSQLLINSCANYFWAKIFLACFILVKVSRLHSLWASAEEQQSILSNTLFKL